MLIFISLGLCNKMGAHKLLVTRVECAVFATFVVLSCACIIVVYVKLQVPNARSRGTMSRCKNLQGFCTIVR